MANAPKCAVRRCQRNACISLLPPDEAPGGKSRGQHDLYVCLVHFYANPAAAQSGGELGAEAAFQINVVNKASLQQQKIEASDLVHDMMAELEEDFEQHRDLALQQSKVGPSPAQRSKSPKTTTARRDSQKKRNVTSPSSSASSLKANIRTSQEEQQTVKKASTQPDIDKLYEWQLKQVQKQHEAKSANPTNTTSTHVQLENTPRIMISAKGSQNGARVIETTELNDVIEDLGHAPEEPWRRKSCALLAGALAIEAGETGSLLQAGSKAIELEAFVLQSAAREIQTPSGTSIESTVNADRAADINTKDVTMDNEDSVENSALDLLRRKATSLKEVSPEQQKRVRYTRRLRSLLRNLRVEANNELRKNILENRLDVKSVVDAKPEDLMDPATAREWYKSKLALSERVRVDAAEDALAQRTLVNTIECPNCGNSKSNIKFSLATHNEASKADVWGNKEMRDTGKERFKCSLCHFRWELH